MWRGITSSQCRDHRMVVVVRRHADEEKHNCVENCMEHHRAMLSHFCLTHLHLVLLQQIANLHE